MSINNVLNFLLLVSMLCTINSAYSLNAGNARNAIDAGVANLIAGQDQNEGGWGGNSELDYVYTSASVEALISANSRTGAYYNGLTWLENHNAKNVELESRKISNLFRNGNNLTPDLDIIHGAKQSTSQTGWGISGGYGSSPLETALVLNALYIAGDATGQANAISYLINSQLNDGGWGFAETLATESGHYWITAEVVLALANHQAQTGVMAVLTQAVAFLDDLTILTSTDANTVSAASLARVTLARYTMSGLDSNVDSLLLVLMGKQSAEGDWGNEFNTANAVTTLANVMGLTVYRDSTRVSVDDEQLRIAINTQLGHAAYGQLTIADIEDLTSLDLRLVQAANLNGLSGAKNLESIKVNANTVTSAIGGLTITITVDSDADNLVDASDNCPFVSNANQANLDGDGFGDVCDSDIDGDGMPNSWEVQYALNEYNASDALVDIDADELNNIGEYQQGTLPRDPDTDGDTMLDGVEVGYGFNPLDVEDGLADFDVDGMSNAAEILAGRHPLVNEPVLIVIITGLLL
ncbi:MAG: thrombospondin type 3 repeat-containing protein [Colwellia sp.]|jgi:hypothetical protein